jgi:hypothetical protein
MVVRSCGNSSRREPNKFCARPCDTIGLIAKESPMTGRKTIQSSAKVAGKNGLSLISDDAFRKLYAALLQCRLIDERLEANASYERWAGREACTAGVAACLRSRDSVTPTRQGVLAEYLQYGSMAPVVDAGLAAATGDGLRHKIEALGNVAVVYSSASDPQRMREIFATAGNQRLPVFYVFGHNKLLTNVCGNVPVIRVDSGDAVAAYRVAHESIERARRGGGPTIMECVAWPSDGKPDDPLAKLEQYLAGKRLFGRGWKEQLEKTCVASPGRHCDWPQV